MFRPASSDTMPPWYGFYKKEFQDTWWPEIPNLFFGFIFAMLEFGLNLSVFVFSCLFFDLTLQFFRFPLYIIVSFVGLPVHRFRHCSAFLRLTVVTHTLPIYFLIFCPCFFLQILPLFFHHSNFAYILRSLQVITSCSQNTFGALNVFKWNLASPPASFLRPFNLRFGHKQHEFNCKTSA
jgi:hypothetical protein